MAKEQVELGEQGDIWELPSRAAPIGFLTWETQAVPGQPKPPAGWTPAFAQGPGRRGNYEGSKEAPLQYGEESGWYY